MHMGMSSCPTGKMPWVLFILSIFHAEISLETPVQTLVGSNASFSFLLSEEPNSSIVTIKDKAGTIVMSARGSLGISSNPIYNYRVNFTGNTYQKQISFILRNVTLDDAGMYIAVLSFPERTIGSQMLIVKETPVQTLVGSNASFSFLLSEEPNSSIVTIKDKAGTIVMSARGSLGISSNPIYNYRVNFTGNTYQKQISFILRNVTLDDAGMYIAVLSFPERTIGSQMLIVKASPSKPQIVELNSPAVAGSDYHLNCSAQSNSEPPIHNLSMFSEWKRDTIPITSSGHFTLMGTELTITGLSYGQDNGVRLICVAFEDQLAKSVSSDEFSIDVKYGPGNSVNLGSFPLTLGVDLHQMAPDITCSATCNPPCEYRWYQNGTFYRNGATLSLGAVAMTTTGSYRCEAYTSVFGLNLSSSTSINIIVYYAPDVSVTINGPTLQNMTLTVLCEARGLPAEYTFHPWKQMWGDKVIRSDLHGTPNSNYSTLKLERLSHQDMGTYICSVDNNITGIDGNLTQTGAVDLKVTGRPVVLKEEDFHFAELAGHSINISIPFYSNPAIKSFIFQKNGTGLQNNSRTTMIVSTSVIDYKFYGITVKLEAAVANLFIQNLTQDDFGNYTLVLVNFMGTKEFRLHLEAPVPSTSESHGVPVAGIVGGIIAGIVIILVVLIGIFLWRRYQCTKKNEHDNDETGDDEESTRRNQIVDMSVKQDVPRGKEYEGLHFTKAEATQYLQLNDITLEENRDPKTRSLEGDSYEKLHPYANSDIQMYSSLKITKTSKG